VGSEGRVSRSSTITPIEVVGERACGREPAHSRADHDGLLADQS